MANARSTSGDENNLICNKTSPVRQHEGRGKSSGTGLGAANQSFMHTFERLGRKVTLEAP